MGKKLEPEKDRVYYTAGPGKPPIFNKDDIEYPHTTKFSYETMSNTGGWQEISEDK